MARINAGDTKAMIRMGDLTRKLRWFEMAAEHGDSEAYFSLGNLYSSEPKRAFEYYLKGAEIEARTRKGYACICEVSKAYSFGLYGVQKNPVEAARWDKIATEISMADAGMHMPPPPSQ